MSTMARCAAALVLPTLFAGMIAAQSAGNWTLQRPSTFPPQLDSYAMAYDSARGQVVMFGGASSQDHVVTNGTWTWDGSNWTQRFPQNTPSARVYHAMVYDSAHRQIVLFGGTSDNGYLSDTWVWDGSNWIQKSPGISPSARIAFAMTYDSARSQTVLFGGQDHSIDFTTNLRDTWVWDGSNWAQKSPPNSPAKREFGGMAYDSAHSQTILFGGDDIAGNLIIFSDTWTWDGSNWTQKLPQNTPPARHYHAMAYDSAHGQVVLFSGTDFHLNAFKDTWTWDGSNWTMKSPQNSPSGRAGAVMAYDAAHGQVMLFGGEDRAAALGSLYFQDTWIWNGGALTPQINTGGIVNNASYTLGSAGSSVAPGSIAAIFGSNLTDGSSCLPPTCNPSFGSNGKLNTTMAGAQVTVSGTLVPIFYATPTQLGIQIPFELAGTSAAVVVSVAGQSSASTTVTVALVSPGIFTYTADGKGPGAITHVNGSAVTAQSPAGPGEIVILYATGLGQVARPVPTGALPAGASTTLSPVMLNIGGIGVIPDYAGLSGCCVGLNQINARVPAGITLGTFVPVVLKISGQSSNTAFIAVQ